MLAALLIAACASGHQFAIPTDQDALGAVHTIFLGDFGGGEGSDLVKEKLRARLLNSGRFEVLESADRADAALKGSAGVEKSQTKGTTDYRGTGMLRLVGRLSEKTIWAHQYKSGGHWAWSSSSSRVADQMADALLDAAGSERKQ
jgi:hypothetical protein